MEKHSLNSWRKRAPHKPVDYLDDRIMIWGHDNDVPLVEKVYVYEGHITPTRMIQDKNVFEITYVHPIYYMHGFSVITHDDLVTTIVLFGHHPNRNPDTCTYCLPDYKTGVKYDEKYFQMLLTNIKTYYLNDCFFTPGKEHIKYKKLNSISMQFNKGE